MINSNLQLERIQKLANHLLNNKINTYVYPITTEPRYIDHGEYIEKKVPFFIWPLLEAVFVFPDEWDFDETGSAYWIHDEEKSTLTSAEKYFGLNLGIFCHLFIPGEQQVGLYGGKEITNHASPADIGANMISLVKPMHAQLN